MVLSALLSYIREPSPPQSGGTDGDVVQHEGRDLVSSEDAVLRSGRDVATFPKVVFF